MSERYPLMGWPDDIPVGDAIEQAIGAASMCWEPRPTGVFDSTLAAQVADELTSLLQAKLWIES